MMLSGVKQCLTKKSFSDAGNANWRHERKKRQYLDQRQRMCKQI